MSGISNCFFSNSTCLEQNSLFPPIFSSSSCLFYLSHCHSSSHPFSTYWSDCWLFPLFHYPYLTSCQKMIFSPWLVLSTSVSSCCLHITNEASQSSLLLTSIIWRPLELSPQLQMFPHFPYNLVNYSSQSISLNSHFYV